MVIAYPLPLFHSQSTSSRHNPASVVETSLKSYAFSVQLRLCTSKYTLLALNTEIASSTLKQGNRKGAHHCYSLT